MEFKVHKEEKESSIEETIANAKKQIEERKYEENLRERGFKNITKMVFAFKGKEVKIETYQNKLYGIKMSHNGTLFLFSCVQKANTVKGRKSSFKSTKIEIRKKETRKLYLKIYYNKKEISIIKQSIKFLQFSSILLHFSTMCNKIKSRKTKNKTKNKKIENKM